jgi:hypothetical protein
VTATPKVVAVKAGGCSSPPSAPSNAKITMKTNDETILVTLSQAEAALAAGDAIKRTNYGPSGGFFYTAFHLWWHEFLDRYPYDTDYEEPVPEPEPEPEPEPDPGPGPVPIDVKDRIESVIRELERILEDL